MIIPIADLKKATDKLFEFLETLGISNLDVDQDYYWSIPLSQKYNPYAIPDDLTIGQLSDDWRELEKIVYEKGDGIQYAFVWLAQILNFLGEKDSLLKSE